MSNIEKFELALQSDENLRRRFEEEKQKIAESGLFQSDGEAMEEISKRLGFPVSASEYEKQMAAVQELDDDELRKVSGGIEISGDDGYGHDNWCLGNWHCLMATRHTESNSEDTTCAKDYQCLSFWHWV